MLFKLQADILEAQHHEQVRGQVIETLQVEEQGMGLSLLLDLSSLLSSNPEAMPTRAPSTKVTRMRARSSTHLGGMWKGL